MNPRFATSLFVAACAALAAPAHTQDLTAGVSQDPQGNVAMYTCTVTAPPGSFAFGAGSLLLGPPLPYPGIQNPLLIDPLLLFGLGVQPIGPSGLGHFQIPAPMPIVNNMPVMMQAAVVDPLGIIALSDVGGAVPGNFAPAPVAPRVQFNGSFNGNNYTLQMLAGPARANVRVLVNGGQRATGYLITDGNGQGQVTVPIPGGVQPGDRVTIEVNGWPVSANY